MGGGGDMPYSLEKGPIWSVVESALRTDAPTTYMFLEYLRDTKKPISLGPIVGSKTLNAGPWNTTQKRADHLDHDWFGMVKDATGEWQKQPDSAWNPVTNPRTGFWINYWGDVESLTRQTFLRAAEVALGLRHDETLDAAQLEHLAWPHHFWPVSVYVKCPQPWFEGWVTWRSWGRGAHDGEVVVHLHTPGHDGSQLLTNPGAGLNAPPVVNPTHAGGDNGMWLITSTAHNAEPPVVTTEPTERSRWPFPTVGQRVKDDPTFVVLCPDETDGGVLPAGRAYQP
jgi:hypothetical protein